MRKHITGWVTNIESVDNRSLLHIIRDNRESEKITYSAPLPQDIVGDKIEYHERRIHGIDYQILNASGNTYGREEEMRFISAGTQWREKIKYFAKSTKDTSRFF